MKAIKATGMVPVFEPKNVTHIFGVMPEVAGEGFVNGTLHLVDIPDTYETIDVFVAGYDDRDQPKKGEAPVVSDAGVVVIPDDWEDKHHMTLNKIARQIVGEAYAVPDGQKATEYDETVIREELARRAAAADENQS